MDEAAGRGMSARVPGGSMTCSAASSGEQRPKLHELDAMRGAAIVGVVLIHVLAAYMTANVAQTWQPFYHSFNQLLKFSTQLFVFVSGVALFYAYGGRNISYGEYLRRRVRNTLVPFLAWSLIYTLWDLRGLGAPRAVAALQSPDFWRQATGRILTGSAYYHLYFIVIIFQLYLIFPVLARLAEWAVGRGLARRCARFTILLGLSLLTGYFYWAGLRRGEWLAALQPGLPGTIWGWILRYADRNGIFWLPYFFLGGLIGTLRLRGRQPKLPALPVLLTGVILAAVLVMAEYWYLIGRGWDFTYLATTVKPLNFLYSLAATFFFLEVYPSAARAARGAVRSLRQIGSFSFGIYLMHPLFLSMALSVAQSEGVTRLPVLQGPLAPPVVAALVLAASYLATAALARLPGTGVLLGSVRRASA